MGTEARREKWANLRRSQIKSAAQQHERVAREYSRKTNLVIPRERGFLVLPPGTFPETAELADFCNDLVAKIQSGETAPATRDDGRRRKSKAQLRTGNLDNETLDLDSPFLRFALREDILAAVANYLGTVPLITQCDAWYSVHQEKELQNSQLYHCDWTATTQIKLFVFATEVDDASGPFTLLGAETSKKLRDKIGYQWSSDDSKISDETVYNAVGKSDEHVLTGAPQTAAFVDSSRCFHFGSRVREGAKPRVLALIQYLTPTAFSFPHDFRSTIPFRHLASDASLSPLQKLALGGEA